MPTSEKERIVRAFLLLLHRESKKPESAIIPPTAWENLPELQASLTQANDDIKIIARGITTWCKDHQYSSILQALRPVQSDAIPKDKDLDKDETEQQIRLGNLSRRSIIPEDEDPDEDENEQQIRLSNLSVRFVDNSILNSIPEDENPDEDETEQQIRYSSLSVRFVEETISQAQGQHKQQSS